MQYDARVTARMKKIEGQLRGILRMMDEEKDCKDVITQLSAVRSAVDRTIGVIVTDNLVDCLSKEDAASIDKNIMVKQAVELLVKSR
ncbi:metal-sensitive transcriptional regulator [Solibacillus silvestris]